jgi:hypothetical protein
MERHCGGATIWMTVLPMRATLAGFTETKAFEKCDDLARFEDGKSPHC